MNAAQRETPDSRFEQQITVFADERPGLTGFPAANCHLADCLDLFNLLNDERLSTPYR